MIQEDIRVKEVRELKTTPRLSHNLPSRIFSCVPKKKMFSLGTPISPKTEILYAFLTGDRLPSKVPDVK